MKKKNLIKGDFIMENGSGQIGVNDLLLARGVGGGAYGGYGGGFLGSGHPGGGGYLTAAAVADGTAAAAKQDNISDTLRFGFDNSLEVARESRNIAQFGRVTDNQFRAELRASDQLAALTAQVADNARAADKNCCDTRFAIADAAKEAAACCCDAKLEAAKNHGQVLAKMEEIDARNIERDLNRANQELTALRTQIACGCCGNG